MAMLENLVTYNRSITAVYIEVIARIKYQLRLIHLEGGFIQDRHNKNWQHLCSYFGSHTYD